MLEYFLILTSYVKKIKLTRHLGFSPFNSEGEFQGLPSWGFTAIYDNLQGNTGAAFAPTNHSADSEP